MFYWFAFFGLVGMAGGYIIGRLHEATIRHLKERKLRNQFSIPPDSKAWRLWKFDYDGWKVICEEDEKSELEQRMYCLDLDRVNHLILPYGTDPVDYYAGIIK